MKTVRNLRLFLFALAIISIVSCREQKDEQTETEALIEEMESEGAEIKKKVDGDETKIKMENDSKKVKIKAEEGETKVKVKTENDAEMQKKK